MPLQVKMTELVRDFQIQTDKLVMYKQRKKGEIIDVAIQSNGNIMKMRHKLEKYRWLKEEPERKWKVNAVVIPMITGTLRYPSLPPSTI